MSDWIIYGIGFTAQILFSSRMIYQWVASEKAKQVVTPLFFWQLSLLASFLLFLYGSLRMDFAIMLGQILNYFIYIRNLQLNMAWQKLPKIIRFFLWLFPLVVIFIYFNNGLNDIELLFNNPNLSSSLLLFGIIGHTAFSARFVYQWIILEKTKIAELPNGFWWISLTGAIMILTYGILRKDPVLIFAQSFGTFIYLRNLKLISYNAKAS